MSQPIFQIVKSKNYEFNDQYRKIQLAPANAHPLKGAATNAIRFKGPNGEKDEEDLLDGSSRNLAEGMDESQYDPLSIIKKGKSKGPDGEDEEEKEEEKEEKLDLEELKTAANTNVWKDEIRGGLLKIFNPKKLEHLKIRNPFKAEKMSHERTVVYTKVGKDNNVITQDSSQDKPTPGLRTYVTYSYYIKSIEAIKRDILKAWKREDKVLALQLAIQGVKLLMDTEEPNFYPAKYTFVIDLLEVFSMLVFERIKKLSFPKLSDERLKEIRESNIEEANINEAAKDICRNWFLKISVIRELMPRIYIQCALTRNMVFLNKDKIKPTIMRLLMTCRGLTDPLIASYCQIYILRIAIELLPKEKVFMKIAFNDFLLNMREGGRFQHKSLSFDEYMTLFEPNLEVIFKFYSQNSTEEDFKEMFLIYENSSQHAEILKKFIKYFSPQMISDNMLQMNKFIQVHNIKNRLELYSLLCDVMNKCLPSQNVIGVLFQQFIKDIYEIKEFVPFLNFTAVLLDLISKNYDSTTRNQFLISILKRFADFFTTIDWTNEGKDKEVFEKLQEFLEKIISSCENVSEIMALEPFFQFLTYLPNTMKKSVCKKFLTRFAESNKKIGDPILVHTVLSIAKNLNDDYGFSMTETEKQDVSKLIHRVILNVDFGKDVEQMLNFLTEVRAYFGNLPNILELLINQGLEIAIKCRRFSRGRISKQIFAIIQGAISFCLISISSIEDRVVRFDYYLKTAQMALLFNLTSQAEALCKSAIGVFAELPKKVGKLPIEDVMETKIKALISFLIILPENPESDYLHMFNGLYAGMGFIKWSKRRGLYIRTRILCDCLAYLCVQLQDKLPYHIENIKSNDSLFPEMEFKEAVFVKFQEVSQDIMKNLAEINAFEVPNQEVAVVITKLNFTVINCFQTYLVPFKKLFDMIQECVTFIKNNKTHLKANNLKGTKFEYMIGFLRDTFKGLKKALKDPQTTKIMEDLGTELAISLN